MAEPVAAGFCFVFIRSTTAIGFDSSTSGGSFTGKNTSRTLSQREDNTPSSLIMKSFSAGLDSSFSGSSVLLLNASRRFAISDVHIDPSVSSFMCGASAGRNVGDFFSGSPSGDGGKNVLAISCLVSVAVAVATNHPLSKIVPCLYICQYVPDLSPVFSFYLKQFLAPQNILQTFTVLRLYLGRTPPPECLRPLFVPPPPRLQ